VCFWHGDFHIFRIGPIEADTLTPHARGEVPYNIGRRQMDPSDSIHGGIDSKTEIYTQRGKRQMASTYYFFNTYYDRYFPYLNVT